MTQCFATLTTFQLKDDRYCVGCPHFRWSDNHTGGVCRNGAMFIHVDTNGCPKRSPACRAVTVTGQLDLELIQRQVKELIETLAFYATGCHYRQGPEDQEPIAVDLGGHANETLANMGFTEDEVQAIIRR